MKHGFASLLRLLNRPDILVQLHLFAVYFFLIFGLIPTKNLCQSLKQTPNLSKFLLLVGYCCTNYNNNIGLFIYFIKIE